MDRKQLDALIPVVFGLVVAVAAIWGSTDVLLFVTVIGGGLVGIYFGVFRGRMARNPGAQRPD